MNSFRSKLTRITLGAALFAACGGDPDVAVPDDGLQAPATGGRAGSGSTAGGRGPIDVGADGGVGGEKPSDPCLLPDPPDECSELQPSGPACGDGELNQDGEVCDDRNTLPGDGCSGVCDVEPFFECPVVGRPCTSLLVCGDGQVDPGEVCDDGNVELEDGCSDECVQDPSYVCLEPGESCVQIFVCGDGRVNGAEKCDDGNRAASDGCDSKCVVEDGYACPLPGKTCAVATFCGDGALQAGEQCDDGNSIGSDGCTAQCRIEADWACDSKGQNCVYTVKCGDGILSGSEVCDDGNTRGGDGCPASCSAQESGWTCARPGFACRTLCGDSLRRGSEQCDDGNMLPNDGCTLCRVDDNTVCTGSPNEPSECDSATCGVNGKEGTEPCDDGNNAWGDGCTPDCKKEPTCVTGSPCTSACGDGVKFPDEPCDDGNNTNGDGCSSSCLIEDGYQCSIGAGAGASVVLPMIARDFTGGSTDSVDPGITSSILDFQWGGDWEDPGNYRDPDTNLNDNWTNSPSLPGTGDAFTNGRDGNIRTRNQQWFELVYDFVGPTLNVSKKPIFSFIGTAASASAMGNCPLAWGALIRERQGFCARQVQNAASFGRWFTDVNEYNNEYRRGLTLRRTGANTYVYDSQTHRADGSAYPSGAGFKGFWPLDGEAGVTRYAQCPLECSGNEPGVCPSGSSCSNERCTATPPTHNFHFTTETHHWFQFSAAAPPTLIFTGDDDVFVFIGGRQVLNLGGIHERAEGRVVLNAAGNATQTRPSGSSPVSLGLANNGIYEIVVFQAERNTCESNYRLELQNFNLQKSVCAPICGDGVRTPDEECDDGSNNTTSPSYGKCTAVSCNLGGYCGDGVKNGSEACDNGVNRNAWGDSGSGACAPGCVAPPACGDGTINVPFEECDLGTGNSIDGYAGCSSSCAAGPFCGDGRVNGPEVCDDGVNDERYGSCTPDCSGRGPYCGDEVVQAQWGEECDGAENCLNCRLGATCGNGAVEEENGEACDDGENLGGYGKCAPGCKLGARCGDGVRNGSEQCDDGDDNTGGYGKCAPGCVYGPYCGDGRLQRLEEECDDANNEDSDGCSAACRDEELIPR